MALAMALLACVATDFALAQGARDHRILPNEPRTPSVRPLPKIEPPSTGTAQRRTVNPSPLERRSPSTTSPSAREQNPAERLRQRRAIEDERLRRAPDDSLRRRGDRIVCTRGIVRQNSCYCRGTDVPRRIGANTYICVTGSR